MSLPSIDPGLLAPDEHLKVTAHYETRCHACDEMIYEGDVIVLLPFDQEWVHEDCLDD